MSRIDGFLSLLIILLRKKNKQAKTNFRGNTSNPLDFGNATNSLLQLSVRFLPRVLLKSSSCYREFWKHGWLHVGLLHGRFSVSLTVMVGGTIVTDAKGSLLIYSLHCRKHTLSSQLNNELWKCLSFSISFAVTQLGLSPWCPKSFKWIATIQVHAQTYTHTTEASSNSCCSLSLSCFKYKLCFWKSRGSDFWVVGSWISTQCYWGLFAFLHSNHTAIFNWPFLLKSFPIK